MRSPSEARALLTVYHSILGGADVVDAATTRVAYTSAASHFDYEQWTTRPVAFFFAGNMLRANGASFVRMSLTQLNTLTASRIHCTGVDPESGSWNVWRAMLQAYETALARRGKSLSTQRRKAFEADYCLPPLSREALLLAMRKAKFCICPRGDSPSTSRVYQALSVGCIPIVVSDHWQSMAAPFVGLLDYSAVILSVREVDAIEALEEALSSVLRSVGITMLMTGTHSGGNVTLRVPAAGSPGARLLEKRLLAMRTTYRAALWGLRRNVVLANLTLVSALAVVASRSLAPEPERAYGV